MKSVCANSARTVLFRGVRSNPNFFKSLRKLNGYYILTGGWESIFVIGGKCMRETAQFYVFGINDKFYLYDWNRIESYGISQEIFDYLLSVKDFTKEMFVRDLRLNGAGFKKEIIALLDEGRLYYEDNKIQDNRLIDISTINL